MAKQTLKSLLGSSDSRKQVSLNLGEVSLSPKVQRAGQYGVVVQQTPKTNAALQFAQNIRFGTQVFGQAVNVSTKAGEEAALTANLGEALDDKEVKGILGYDKAYQRGLVKRHMVSKQGELIEEFKNFASDPENLKLDTNEFLDALEAKKAEEISKIREAVGGNANRDEAIAAFSNTFIEKLYGESVLQHKEAKKNSSIMLIVADGQDQAEKLGMAAAYDYVREELTQEGFDLSPAEVSEKLRNLTEARFTNLLLNGRLEEAQKTLDEYKDYVLIKSEKEGGTGAKLSKTKEGSTLLKKLTAELGDARDAKDGLQPEQEAASKDDYKLMINIMTNPSSFEQKKDSITRYFVGLGVKPEVIEKELADLDENTLPSEMFVKISTINGRIALGEVEGVEADTTIELAKALSGNFTSTVTSEIFTKAIQGIYSESDYQAIRDSIEAQYRANPEATSSELNRTYKGRRLSSDDQRITDILSESRNKIAGWYHDDDSAYKSVSKGAISKINAGKEFGISGTDYAIEFNGRFKDAMPELWQDSDGDVDIFNGFLENKRDEIIQDLEKEKAKDDKISSRYEDYIRSQDDLSTVLSAAQKDSEVFVGTDYKSMTASAMADARNLMKRAISENVSFGETKQFEKGIAERTLLLTEADERRRKRLLKASVVVYGFPTLESFDDNLRQQVGVGYYDIPLGKEVRDSAKAAIEAYQDDNPTDEQKNVIETWKNKGFDEVQLNDLLAASNYYLTNLY